MIIDDLSERVLGACFQVSNELGAGFLESVYEKALLITLRDLGLEVRSQVPLKVHYLNQCVGEFYADLVIENELIVELKAVKSLLPEHLAQGINYLKATGLNTALLVNFGRSKIEYRRLYNSTAKCEMVLS